MKAKPYLPFTVVMPYPLDHHPTHRDVTSARDLRIFKKLAVEYKIKMQILFYFTASSGIDNTFLMYSNNEHTVQGSLFNQYQDLLAHTTALKMNSLVGSHGGDVFGPENFGGNRAESFRRASVVPSGEDRVHKAGTSDYAMVNIKGGIDLTPANMNLQTKIDSRLPFGASPVGRRRGNDSREGGNDSGEGSNGINFTMSKEQGLLLEQLKNAPGFVPVIINIQPLKSLPEFLGLNQEPADKLVGEGNQSKKMNFFPLE